MGPRNTKYVAEKFYPVPIRAIVLLLFFLSSPALSQTFDETIEFILTPKILIGQSAILSKNQEECVVTVKDTGGSKITYYLNNIISRSIIVQYKNNYIVQALFSGGKKPVSHYVSEAFYGLPRQDFTRNNDAIGYDSSIGIDRIIDAWRWLYSNYCHGTNSKF